MSKFTAALALAKPLDTVDLPADVYLTKIVSATAKPGSTATIVRLDLETISGKLTGDKFKGRKQIKNQPISAEAASYVCALCTQTGNEVILTNEALANALENGEENVLRMFVGKSLTIARSYKPDGETNMKVMVTEA